ncbi:HD domain-containing phosphohydrolase [Bdellovibrionota bacterium FG-2]
MTKPDELEYQQVQILNILPNQILNFDLYLFLPANNKHIKYVAAGDRMREEQLQQLKFKKTMFMHIRCDDAEKYNSFIKSNIRNLLNNEDKNLRIMAIKASAKLVMNSLDMVGSELDLITYSNNCVEVAKSVADELTHSNISDAYSTVLEFMSGTPSLSNHSLMVSSLGVFMAMSLGNYAPKTFTEVAYGGLIHDIGLSALPLDITAKYLAGKEMTPEETLLLQTHPAMGLKMIEKLTHSKIITENIIKVILEHHENMSGTGFPQKLIWSKLSYVPKIVSLADKVALAIAKNIGSDDLSLKNILLQILKKQEQSQIQNYDKRMIRMILENF